MCSIVNCCQSEREMRREERDREKETQKEGKGCEKERLRSQQQMVELLQACVDVIFIRQEESSQLSHSNKIEKRNEEDVSSKAQEERYALQL